VAKQQLINRGAESFEQFVAFNEIRAELATFAPRAAAPVTYGGINRKRTQPIRFLLRDDIWVLA
jgi:hypothetical protein